MSAQEARETYLRIRIPATRLLCERLDQLIIEPIVKNHLGGRGAKKQPEGDLAEDVGSGKGVCLCKMDVHKLGSENKICKKGAV